MRTFHTGGVAGGDITQGLPRVEELFEARKPKGLAIISEFAGYAQLNDTKKKREIIVANNETGESKTYLIPYGSRINGKVVDGAWLEAGDPLTEGSVNPHDILRIKGVRAVQDYMLREVQRVYRLQGVEINDKHIEMIVRQMLKKIRIEENGDSNFLPGAMVDILEYDDVNEALIAEGKTPAEGKQVMLGITKASLATNSFLSAASFQETTKVLTEAAIKGKVDNLIGLKENVIIGKLIPAGTGMKRYHDVKLDVDAQFEAMTAEATAEEFEVDEFVEEFDDVESPNANIYNLGMNFLFYINAFPDCIIDGVPNGVKRNPKGKVISTSDKIVSHTTVEHGFVRPHFRSGYFRHLNSDWYVNCKGKVQFIASTMVKGKAKTVIERQ
jgi:DNA-directed RNA polymerase subunit beta'